MPDSVDSPVTASGRPASASALRVVVHAKQLQAEGVVSLDLRPVDGAPLPLFEAGAHIDVYLPIGTEPLMRQYSLCNDPSERHRYVVAVGLDANSRGGSRWVHAGLSEGQALQVSAPRNQFALAEEAPRSVLIAGGIGITPILAMARRLAALSKPWTLYYCVRTPGRAAFVRELMQLGGEVIPVFDGMPGIAPLDVAQLVAQTSSDTHLYCCGPAGLMRAFMDAVSGRDPKTVHVEWFAAPAKPEGTATGCDGAFDIHLARTRRTLRVPADKSILDVLLDAGLDVPHSCRDGVCASCETTVLAGECDHRDLVLMGAEAAANDRMMICVSRCKGESLTLDL